MSFVRNFPFFTIMLGMLSGIVSSALSGKWARRVTLTLVTAVLCMSGAVLAYAVNIGHSVTYMMGHFPAPWGNEIRFGTLEAFLATYFAGIMLLAVLGGMSHVTSDVDPAKENLFYVLVDMMLSSLLAMIYTNDLFTGYVFVEINTIAACGMIMIRQNGHSIVAAIRYMVMSLIGSGLFLIGISILYDVTGQLLMVPAHDAIQRMMISDTYTTPLLVLLSLISVGMAIKSGLYPFHSWIPETYGYATPTASAILSSLVSKGYVILLIKIFYRVVGFGVVLSSHILNALFILGIVAMVMGSLHAIMQTDCRKMIAYSSVAQIGYIYMGIGLGSKSGMIAAIFHLLTHAATKSLLFISAVGLYEVSDGRTDYVGLRNAGYRNRVAGIAFSVGALSMVGFPMLSGFISKYLFATASLERPSKMIATLLALIVSTILNAIYFLRQVVTIYSGQDEEEEYSTAQFFKEAVAGSSFANHFAMVLLIALNLFLGLGSSLIVGLISKGLDLFS